MKTIHFHEPPAAQKIGGLEAAITSLRAALERAGIQVAMNPTEPGEAVCAHFHGLWQPRFPALARAYASRGIPYVASPHGMLEPWAWRHRRWKKLPYWHLVEKRWTRRASAVLATAPQEASRLRKFFPRTRVESLPLGLTGSARPDYAAARELLGWGENERVLLFLSRIHEKKGLDLLLTALGNLPPAFTPNVRLVIVGPEEQPAYAAHCRSLAAGLPRVEWRGAVWGEARWPFLQGADLFCLPTHSENFGLAVLESLQVGTPVLTTTETPWADALRERGYLCTPTVSDVGRALTAFLAEPPRIARPDLSAWAWQEYHWDALAPRYLALYSAL